MIEGSLGTIFIILIFESFIILSFLFFILIDAADLFFQLLLVIIHSTHFTDQAKGRLSTVIAECQYRLTQGGESSSTNNEYYDVGALESLQLLDVLFAINREVKQKDH